MSAGFADAAGRLAGFAGVVLGWSPAAFWAATPAELAGMAGVLAGEQPAPPLPRADMTALMEAFPDG